MEIGPKFSFNCRLYMSKPKTIGGIKEEEDKGFSGASFCPVDLKSQLLPWRFDAFISMRKQ